MDPINLLEQLNQLGEQEKIEAKTASKIGKSILETICAFANEPNLGGGYLLLGISKPSEHVTEDYQVVGIQNPEKLLEDLVSQCRTVFNKPIPIEAVQNHIDDKIVVTVFVPEVNQNTKPIYFQKQGLPQGAYRRMATSDVRCTEDDLLLLYQNRDADSYDFAPVDDATWQDINLDAIEEYRKVRAATYANATELNWSDEELLQSLGCLKKVNRALKFTVAGILLFGTRACLRRLFSDIKIEYIRVPGTQWMSDPDNRYTSSIEIRGPIMASIRRAEAAIIDDLPTAFSLPEGSLQREDIPVIPFKVIREAVVNAVMHRDYRVQQAIQIIRYANRIEIRNPGYSLIAEEHLGDPGSKSRNLKLSAVLHDTQFAEKKGTGIGLMRKQMQNAGLSPPLFESDRNRDLFVATFLFHHFLSDEDIRWLANFKIYCLSDEQAKALIFTREVGAINNAAYRNLNQVDILTASQGLRQLKENDLLISKNKSTATYYLPSQKFVESLAKEHQLQSKEHQLVGKEHQLSPKEHQLEVSNYANQDLTKLLSKDLQNRLNELGKKAVPYKVRDAILALCKYKEVSSSELATYLKRDKKRLIRKFLTPMIEEGILVYKYPQMLGHPRQAYRLKQSDE